MKTLRSPKPWLLLPLAGLLLAGHVVKDVLGDDAGAFGAHIAGR